MNQSVSVTLTQGRRQYMEDTYVVTHLNKPMRSKSSLLAVFDGHGGDAVSIFCRDNFAQLLHKHIASYPDMGIALRKTFEELDQSVKGIGQRCGSTAAVLVRVLDTLWSANCGDSETMVSYKNGHLAMLTQSHKVEDEVTRLKGLGATITYDDGCARLSRMLNLARSIGDYHLKQYVISIPYVKSIKLDHNVEYVMIGSDGLWDVWDAKSLHDEIKMLKKQMLASGLNYTQMTDALNMEIVKKSLLRGSGDNITVIICFF